MGRAETRGVVERMALTFALVGIGCFGGPEATEHESHGALGSIGQALDPPEDALLSQTCVLEPADIVGSLSDSGLVGPDDSDSWSFEAYGPQFAKPQSYRAGCGTYFSVHVRDNPIQYGRLTVQLKGLTSGNSPSCSPAVDPVLFYEIWAGSGAAWQRVTSGTEDSPYIESCHAPSDPYWDWLLNLSLADPLVWSVDRTWPAYDASEYVVIAKLYDAATLRPLSDVKLAARLLTDYGYAH